MLTALSQHSVDVPLSARLVSLMGLFALMGLAWLAGTRSRVIPWRVVLWGLALQVGFALFVLRTPWTWSFLSGQRRGEHPARVCVSGSRFRPRTPRDREPARPRLGSLAAIVFFAALMSVLYHLRVMQAIVWAFDVAMRRTMRTSGAEMLSAAANIFVGQTEAPLLVRPYVQRITHSSSWPDGRRFRELRPRRLRRLRQSVRRQVPRSGGHLLTCSILSAPSSLLIAKLMLPETEHPETSGMAAKWEKSEAVNVVDAAARGAWDGLTLTGNVVAQLIAFVALVAIVNALGRGARPLRSICSTESRHVT